MHASDVDCPIALAQKGAVRLTVISGLKPVNSASLSSRICGELLVVEGVQQSGVGTNNSFLFFSEGEPFAKRWWPPQQHGSGDTWSPGRTSVWRAMTFYCEGLQPPSAGGP